MISAVGLWAVMVVAPGCGEPPTEEPSIEIPDGCDRQAEDETQEAFRSRIIECMNAELESEEPDYARFEVWKSWLPQDRHCRRQVIPVEDDVKVLGRAAGDLEVERWFQGTATMDDGTATLLVFFEVWCPHCQRAVPKVQGVADEWAGAGLNVIGLTKRTRGVTEQEVEDFLAERDIPFPVAQEDRMAMSQRFGVKGLPAAAVVKDGKIVWRGHPARIDDAMFRSWLELP